MSKVFKKIAIIAPTTINDIEDTLIGLIKFLQSKKCKIVCEKNTAKLLKNIDLPVVNLAELGKNCDLIIVIGGDGSILRAAQNAAKYKTPIIGINRGKLGFLTDIRPTEIETRLAAVLEGKYWTAKRSFLKATMTKKEGLALNDVVISSGRTPHMLEFEIHINNEFVCSHRADGLIIATPTGSTAYSLSGGGPIVYPTLDALVISPMFSHTLGSRPIVVPADSDIRIDLSVHNQTACNVSCDGTKVASVPAGKSIEIKKHAHSLELIHPLDYSYYESLRSKLYWGKKLI